MDWSAGAIVAAAVAVAGGLVGFFHLSRRIGELMAEFRALRSDVDKKANGGETAIRLATMDENVKHCATVDRVAALEHRVGRAEAEIDRTNSRGPSA